jgi:hypothetical protein
MQPLFDLMFNFGMIYFTNSREQWTIWWHLDQTSGWNSETALEKNLLSNPRVVAMDPRAASRARPPGTMLLPLEMKLSSRIVLRSRG